MRKILAVILCLSIALICCSCGGKIGIAKQFPEPQACQVCGDWIVLALSRSDETAPEGYFDAYLDRLETELKLCKGVLSERKYTEYARVALTLAALGEDPADFRGFDVLSPLTDIEKVSFQGNNGPMWALIALSSDDYAGVEAQREQMLQEVLACQNEDGGYGLAEGAGSGVDLTAMAITALSAHRERAEVAEALNRALAYLKSVTKENGFDTSESCAQALLAYSSMGMKEEAEQMHKWLENYAVKNGYCHELSKKEANGLATEQAIYATVAYERMSAGKSPLLDMRNK